MSTDYKTISLNDVNGKVILSWHVLLLLFCMTSLPNRVVHQDSGFYSGQWAKQIKHIRPDVYQVSQVLQKNCMYNTNKFPEKQLKTFSVSNIKMHESDIGQLVKLMQ